MKDNSKKIIIIICIALLVVLGLIIGIRSFNHRNKYNNQEEYNKLINNITQKSIEYLNNTGYNGVFVKDLIQEGYIEATNNTLIDPRNKHKNLNCYYYDGNKLNASDDCQINGQEPITFQIKYCDASSNENCEPNITNLNSYVNFSKIKFLVVSDKNLSVKWLDKNTLLKEGLTYTLNLNDYNKVNVEVQKDGQKVKRSFEIKIDTIKPTVKKQDFDSSIKKGSQEVKFTYEDNVQIAKCYFSKDKNLNQAIWNDCLNNKIYKENITEYLYVKDIAGNISDPLEIKVTNIVDDHDAPIISDVQVRSIYNNCNSLSASLFINIKDATDASICVTNQDSKENCKWHEAPNNTLVKVPVKFQLKNPLSYDDTVKYNIYIFTKDSLENESTKPILTHYEINQTNKCCEGFIQDKDSGQETCENNCSGSCTYLYKGYSLQDGKNIQCEMSIKYANKNNC